MSYKVFNRFELARLILSSLSGIRYISVDGAGTVFSTGTFILSPGDNITFSTFSNGVSIIGAPGGTVSGFTNTSIFMQTTERNNYFYTSNNTFANSTHTHGNLFLVNMSGTSASNGLTLHAPFVSNAGNVLAAGTQTANTSGTVLFSNSNGVSFGMLGSSVITASFSQQNASVVASLNGSSGSLSLSVSDNLTLSNTNSTIIIGGPKSILNSLQVSGNSTLYSGSGPIVNSGVILAGGDNITLGKSENTIYINAGSITQTVQTQNVVVPALSNTTYTSGTVVFSGLNNLTVSNNGNTINLIGPNTHAQQTGISGIAGSAASTITNGTVVFANANGISFGLSSNTMTASHNALTSQSVQTQNVHNVIIQGNTTGTVSEISSGTLYLAGGNNITLSQDQNSISIIGGAGSGGLDGLNALVVNSGSSTSATTLTLSNSNNVSFGINAGVITASASYSQYNQVVSAPNGTFSFQTLSLANSNGVSWSTGSQGLYASVNTDYIPSANSSSFMITSERGNYYYTSVSRSLYFADSNGVSFGSSTSGSSTTITASFSGGGGGGGGIGSFLLTGNTTSNTTVSGSTIVLSGGNNITLGGTNNSVIRIDGPQGSLYFGNSNGVTFGTSVNGISTSVTASFSGGTGGGGGVAVQGSGTYSQNTGTVIFSNSNGVSFGLNTNGVMTASYNSTHTHGNINIVGTNISGSYTSSSNGLTLSFSVNPPSAAQEYNWMSISGNTSGTNSISGSTILLIAGNNITLSGYSSSRIRIDGPSTSNLALSTHTHGNPTLVLTNLSGTTSSASNGLTISLSANSGGGAGNILAAGTQTANTTGTVVFSNSNGISFGMNNSSVITASHEERSLYFANSNNVTFGTSTSGSSTTVTASIAGVGGAADGYNILAAGTQTANTTGTIIFSNSNSITFGMNNSSIITASFSQSTHDHPYVNTSQSSVFQQTSNTSAITTGAVGRIWLSGNYGGNSSLSGNTIRIYGGNNITVSGTNTTAFYIHGEVGSVYFNDANNVTFGASVSSNSTTITASVAGGTGGGAGNVLAAGTQTANTSGTVVFSNSNNFTFGMSDNSIITASFSESTHEHPYINTSQSSLFQQSTGVVYWQDGNGISFGSSASSVSTSVTLSYDGIRSSVSTVFQHISNTSDIIASAMNTSERGNYFYTSNNTFANSTHTHGNPTLYLTNISGTTASASNGLSLSLSVNTGGAGGAGNVIAAGTQTANTSGTVIFSNSNGISFGMSNNSVVTASHEERSLYFANSNNVTFGTSTNGSSTTVTASVSAAGGNEYYLYHYDPIFQLTASSITSHSTNRTFVNQIDVYNPIVFNNIILLKSFSMSVPDGVTTATTVGDTLGASFSVTLLKRSEVSGNGSSILSTITSGSGALTLSYLFVNVSQSYGAAWITNSTGGTTRWSTSNTTTISYQSSAFTGVKYVQIPMNVTTLYPGEYFVAFKDSTSGGSFSYSNVVRNIQGGSFGRFGSGAYANRIVNAGRELQGNGYVATVSNGMSVSNISSYNQKMLMVFDYLENPIY